MKLKKIAALALAGVMAVSMLAGCGTDKKPGSGEGEGEGTTTSTGYSATLEGAVELTADQAKYISFADNAADQAALEKAVSGMSTQSLEDIAKSYTTIKTLEKTNTLDGKKLLADLKDDLNTADILAVGKMQNIMPWYADANKNTNKINASGVRTGVVYAVNGGVDVNVALKAIAADVKTAVKNAPDESKNGTTAWDYTYTVSASVVTRAQQANYTGATDSATFVLVTISRTVTNA